MIGGVACSYVVVSVSIIIITITSYQYHDFLSLFRVILNSFFVTVTIIIITITITYNPNFQFDEDFILESGFRH
jgi:hypothetical protein